MGMRRCSTEAKALCPDGRYCEENASFRAGSECDDFNQQVDTGRITEGQTLRTVQTIRWRSISDPPPDYQHVLGWPEEETYPFPQSRECYLTGRTPWAYFPGIGAQYRIAYWAEMPAGPVPQKGAKKK